LGEAIGKLRYYYWTSGEIAGAPVVVTRTGWTSEVGYEVYLTDTSKGTEVYEAIMKAGARHGLRPTGPSDIRRIEGAIYNWGADMTYENNAFELGLDRLVDFDLDDSSSISMAAYRRIQKEGVAQRINGVIVEGEPFPALNNTKWPVAIAGRRVGKVTSAIYSPRLGANIGYAWLPVANSHEGQRITVETEWGERDATVASMPFVDPQKKIPLA
jgi:aminomethyltransferase